MLDSKTQQQLLAIGKRLRIYLKSRNLGINELGRKAGTSGGQISFILQGRVCGVEKFMQIFRCLPDLNSDWLLFGEGRMLQDLGSVPTLPIEPLDSSKSVLEKYTPEALRHKLATVQKKHIALLEDYTKLLKKITK